MYCEYCVSGENRGYCFQTTIVATITNATPQTIAVARSVSVTVRRACVSTAGTNTPVSPMVTAARCFRSAQRRRHRSRI